MASPNVVQILTKGVEGSASNRSTYEQYIAGAAITKGDFVMLDTSATGADRALVVIQSAGVDAQVVGVAVTAATAAGDRVKVITAGYVEGANVASATTIGQSLYLSSVAGRAIGSTAAASISAQVTGNAAPQATAHGLGVTPLVYFLIPSSITGGAFAVTALSADATSVTATVTTGEAYKVIAFAPTQRMAVALEGASGNKCDVWLFRRA